MTVLLYLAAFFVPLGTNVLSFDVGPFQMSPFRACIFIAILLHFLSSVTKNIGSVKIIIKKNCSGFALVFMVVWLVYAVFTFIWAKDYTAWLKNVYFIFIGVSSVILYGRYLNTDSLIIKAAKAFELGIAAQTFIGWYEIITRNYLFIEMTEKNARNYLTGPYRIPIAMQHNPNNFATLMFVGLAIAVFIFYHAATKRERILSFIMGVNCIILIFATTSRANILAVLITLFFMLLFGGKKKFSLLVGAICIILLLPQTTEYINKVLQFSLNDAGGSDSVRINLIKIGLLFVGQTFGFGVGAGQAEYWVQNYGIAYPTAGISNLHNWWMELITNYGIIVFLGYLVFYIKMWFSFRRWSKIHDYKKEAFTCGFLSAFLIGYIIACTSPSSMVSLEWSWMFLALLISYVKYIENYTSIPLSDINKHIRGKL